MTQKEFIFPLSHDMTQWFSYDTKYGNNITSFKIVNIPNVAALWNIEEYDNKSSHFSETH